MSIMQKLSILLVTSMLGLIGCVRYVEDTRPLTFDDRIFMNSFGQLLVEAENGLDVTINWEFVDEIDSELVSYLEIYDSEANLISEILVSSSASETDSNSIVLDYAIRSPAGGWSEGDYNVEVGWYTDTSHTDHLIITHGTSDLASIQIRLFGFSIDATGNFVSETIEIDADS